MAWVTMRAIGSHPASRRGPGVTPTLYQEMSLLRNSLLNAMREEAPVNKNPNAPNRGALRKSIKASPWMTDGVHWRTEFTALEYILYVIHGTKPHRIEAKAGGVLVFQRGGGPGLSGTLAPISYSALGGAAGKLGRRGGASIFKVPAGYSVLKGGLTFARAVEHPGTQANNFVERAVDRTMRQGTPGLTMRVQRALDDDILQLVMVPAA
jgi:hypothetical protein